MVGPKGRKHLCADALLRSIQDVFSHLPDHRKGDAEIPLGDALMSALAMFSLTSPSWLAFDKVRAEDNVPSISGIGRVPCDTSMRESLAPVEPAYVRPAFKRVFRHLPRGKALEAMVFVEGHSLWALDGTGSFASQEIHGESCLETPHRNGTVTSAPQLLGAACIHPDTRAVLPLMPEPIVTQDGSEKHDGERHAAKRFVTKFRREHPHLKVMVTEDSLSSNAPHIETWHAHDMRYILGVKEGDHAFLFAHVAEAEQAGRVTYDDREDRHQGMHHRFRFVCGMPLPESQPSLRVNVSECWETVQGTVPHCSGVTDLRVNKGTVYRIMQGARARWRIDNETFNTLKNQGDHCEHNVGHGDEHLAVVCAELMRWAFLVDQGQQLCCPLFQEARAQWGSKRLLWEKMSALCFDDALASMRELVEALVYGLKKSAPILATDSSWSASRLRTCQASGAMPPGDGGWLGRISA